jgi:hypothetical protein
MRAILCGTLMALAITGAETAAENTDSGNYVLPGCRHVIDPNFGRGTQTFALGRLWP